MKGLLSVSFGTTHADTRARTIDAVDKALADAFPDRAFYSAWTSPRIVAKVEAERGEHHDTLDEAFSRIGADGVDDLVVATTCLMQGGEMRKIVAAARAWESRGSCSVRVALPLMTSSADHARLASAIVGEFSGVPDGDALILMGHGSPYGSNQLYSDVQDALHALGKPNFFVATVEGEPTFEDTLALVEQRGAQRVVLAPLMIVAGDHARNDMAGSDDSWAAQLRSRGFKVEVVMKGLGEYSDVRDLVVEHARNAEPLDREGA